MNVSRETLDRLRAFESSLLKWNERINLISRSSIPDFWQRHIEDSAQIWDIGKPPALWGDLGSGGGLPALVLAILAKDTHARTKFRLIESDQRKCAFLRSVIREQELNAQVISKRIEAADTLNADVISARALAPLTDLLGYAQRHMKPGGVAFFPKGSNWQKEREIALKSWVMTCTEVPSKTQSGAAILKIEGLQRV